jgi:hypothetical protein
MQIVTAGFASWSGAPTALMDKSKLAKEAANMVFHMI